MNEQIGIETGVIVRDGNNSDIENVNNIDTLKGDSTLPLLFSPGRQDGGRRERPRFEGTGWGVHTAAGVCSNLPEGVFVFFSFVHFWNSIIRMSYNPYVICKKWWRLADSLLFPFGPDCGSPLTWGLLCPSWARTWPGGWGGLCTSRKRLGRNGKSRCMMRPKKRLVY